METVRLTIQDTQPLQEQLGAAAALLTAGETVVFPTETVYGLGANALDATAVLKIFEIKNRPVDNPLIAHVDGIAMAKTIVRDIPDMALALMQKFWPGPLTIVLPKQQNIPDCVTAGGDTVAVRCPAHPVALALITRAGVPVVAPSANRSGKPSPTECAAVLEDLGGKIPMVIDGGACRVGVESTVVLPQEDGIVRVLRPGAITEDMLKTVCNTVILDKNILQPVASGQPVASPGMKHRHYAPKAPLTLLRGTADAQLSFLKTVDAQDVGILCFEGEAAHFSAAKVVTYGREDDALSQSQALFAALRQFDHWPLCQLYARAPQTDGIGLAVYNRLLRAAEFSVLDV